MCIKVTGLLPLRRGSSLARLRKRYDEVIYSASAIHMAAAHVAGALHATASAMLAAAGVTACVPPGGVRIVSRKVRACEAEENSENGAAWRAEEAREQRAKGP